MASVVPLYYFVTRSKWRIAFILVILLLVLNVYTTGTRASYPVILFVLSVLVLRFSRQAPRVAIMGGILAIVFAGFVVKKETVEYLKDSVDFTTVSDANANSLFRLELSARLFELGLGQAALAFVGASRPEDHAAIDRVLAEAGRADFAEAWLRARGQLDAAAALRRFNAAQAAPLQPPRVAVAAE